MVMAGGQGGRTNKPPIAWIRCIQGQARAVQSSAYGIHRNHRYSPARTAIAVVAEPNFRCIIPSGVPFRSDFGSDRAHIFHPHGYVQKRHVSICCIHVKLKVRVKSLAIIAFGLIDLDYIGACHHADRLLAIPPIMAL